MEKSNKKDTSQKELKEQHDRFQLMFKTMNLGVTYQNSKGQIIDINHAALKVLGLTLDQVQGKTSLDPSWKTIHEDGSDYPGETHPSMIALKTGQPVLNKIMGVINSAEKEYRWIKIDAFPQFKDGQKEPFQVFTTFEDITAIKKADLLLRENELRYRKTQQIGEVGNWEYNFEAKHLWGSDQAYKIFGLDPKVDQLTFDLIESYLVDPDFVRKSKIEFIETGGNYSLEYRIIPKGKNKIRTVHSTAELVCDKKGNPIKIIGAIQDISKKKQAENQLKESEEKFFKVLKNSSEAIVFARLKDFSIINSNEAASKLIGYSLEELKDTNLLDLNLWTSKKESEIFIKSLKTNGSIQGYEGSFTLKNKETQTWSLSGEIIPIDNEEFILLIVENITEIRKTQEELKHHSDFAFAMTENHPAGIVACNTKGELVVFNKAAKKWHGVDLFKIPQEKWAAHFDLYKADEKTLLQTDEIPLVQALKGKEVVNQEMVIKPNNKEPRHVICNGSAFLDSDGKNLGALIVMNDMTEYRLKEKELDRTQQKISKALEEVEKNKFLLKESEKIVNVGSWELNLSTQKVTWSDQVFRIHGLPVGQHPPLGTALDYFIDGSKEILSKAIEQSISQNKKYDLDLRFQNAQNEKLWINTVGYPVTNSKNEVIGLRGVIQDITEKKLSREKIEKALKNVELSEILLKESEKIANVGSWEINLKTQKLIWSDQIFKLHGLPIGQLPDLENAMDFFIEGSKEILAKAIEESISKKKKYDLELRFQNAQNQKLWVNTIGFPVLNDKNEVVGLRGVFQDITERKTSSEKIKKALKKAEQSEFLLNESGRIAKVGAWDFDLATQKLL
ncbi:hypothetical protein GCM10011416_12770 [Polaribacter pacificus]|uniref:histidine kinase n=1 Tax=Polaribacter pacificus TaxID=1775173 RepID=A0A917MDD6_9FLAO|nr:PAS domain-containing protein [Polaribacter pacificus]GGG96446.1 hypothetical protein GCM10011416_12770 [Polaribacter pacificus]